MKEYKLYSIILYTKLKVPSHIILIACKLHNVAITKMMCDIFLANIIIKLSQICQIDIESRIGVSDHIKFYMLGEFG